MRQVPQYLLIGNGRVACHFRHYFSLLHLPYLTWHRAESSEKLFIKLQQSTHILYLINDQAIDDFIKKNTHVDKLHIHFSGSLVSPLAFGAHPLMTFSHDLYTLAQYQAIPFVLDQDAPAFHELLPGLANPHVRLQPSLKARYHALCVLSGNFSCMLWQKLMVSIEKEFNLPVEIVHPYLQQQMQNLLTNAETALSGPLVRNDTQTLTNNLMALDNDPFQQVYQSFVRCYEEMK